MIKICDKEKCTGCGMCSNICPNTAISMIPDIHGFIFPNIDQTKCVNCGLCKKKCTVNNPLQGGNITNIYAAWNMNNKTRKLESSGGLFSVLATQILKQGGVVFGVAWSKDFLPEHVIIQDLSELSMLYGSKYAQSNTGLVYKNVKDCLSKKLKVLFSGTPCQVAGLYSFLGREYDELYTIDLICHGVPSSDMLKKYYNELDFNSEISYVNLRHKDPYWDYEFVTIKCGTDIVHHKLTVEDAYYNLFNIGYSLRESCHSCQYTNMNRMGDITLADFWNYKPHSIKTLCYNKGTSLVLINSQKGQRLFDTIKKEIYFENKTIDDAIKTNKCLYESFTIDKVKLNKFWQDYEAGMSIDKLNKKYTANMINIPNYICLRRLYDKWKWIIGK